MWWPHESAKGSKCTLILLASTLRLMVNGESCLDHESKVDAIECTGITPLLPSVVHPRESAPVHSLILLVH